MMAKNKKKKQSQAEADRELLETLPVEYKIKYYGEVILPPIKGHLFKRIDYLEEGSEVVTRGIELTEDAFKDLKPLAK
jgi:hypothetical protein